MKNLKDAKTMIFPSTTRAGKELPSSSALDSTSVLGKLVTPKPATAMNSDMPHVTIRLDAQFGTPYSRSAGFDTDNQ